MNSNIIPIPKLLRKTGGYFSLIGEVSLAGELDSFNRNYLLTVLNEHTVLAVKESVERIISFSLDKQLGDEAYELFVSEMEIKLKSRDKKGQFYAIVSLLQLFNGNKQIDCLEIHDEPRYKYRGFLIDISRHFIQKEEIIRLIEISAINKLNYLHLHLTDDQGWRIEIEKYPRLTDIGSNRTASPASDYIASASEYKNCGFLSKTDIKDIIKYANDRNIEVIPEINMPGHCTAAIAAYNELLCSPYEAKVSTKAGIHRDILCIGKEENFRFIFDVLEEIFDLFPAENIHLGGDEVLKANWINCEKCMEVVKKNNLDNPHQMQTYFINVIIDFAKKKGKKVTLWNDAFTDKTLDKSTVCEFWNAFGRLPEIQEIVKVNSSEVIDANSAAYYFDYSVAVISLKTTYNYESIFEEGDYNLKGVEMALWTEAVHSRKILNERLFPRMFAFAETAWSPKANKSYVDFKQRVLRNEDFFKKYGISLSNQEKWEYSGLRSKVEYLKQIRKMLSIDIFKAISKMKKINKIKFKTLIV